MMELVVKILASYLVGSLMGSLIVGRLRGGVDIRELGSGNAGGTNALRTQGGAFAFWVMLIDIGKGFLATWAIAHASISGISGAAPELQSWLPPLCGLAAIVGHVWPLWYGFRGGKGVATVIGAVLGINAWLLVPILLTWLLSVIVFGYVGFASIAAAIALPVYVAWSGVEPLEALIVFGILVAVLVIYTHRSNIARMRARTEPRARKLWLLGRRHG
jgi:glycerol-3-phosphate acyltransferase PlsY